MKREPTVTENMKTTWTDVVHMLYCTIPMKPKCKNHSHLKATLLDKKKKTKESHSQQCNGKHSQPHLMTMFILQVHVMGTR